MKTFRHSLLALAAGVSAAIIAACATDTTTSPAAARSSSSAVQATATSSPTFLAPDPTAPAIANPVITFWAKRNVDTTVLDRKSTRLNSSHRL